MALCLTNFDEILLISHLLSIVHCYLLYMGINFLTACWYCVIVLLHLVYVTVCVVNIAVVLKEI